MLGFTVSESEKMYKSLGKLRGIDGLPITCISPRVGHLSEWTNLFRVYLIENGVEQRCGRTRGIVGQLIDVMADYRNVSIDRVRQLYQRYRRLQRLP